MKKPIRLHEIVQYAVVQDEKEVGDCLLKGVRKAAIRQIDGRGTK